MRVEHDEQAGKSIATSHVLDTTVHFVCASHLSVEPMIYCVDALFVDEYV